MLNGKQVDEGKYIIYFVLLFLAFVYCLVLVWQRSVIVPLSSEIAKLEEQREALRTYNIQLLTKVSALKSRSRIEMMAKSGCRLDYTPPEKLVIVEIEYNNPEYILSGNSIFAKIINFLGGGKSQSKSKRLVFSRQHEKPKL